MVLDSKQMEWASRQGLETAALKKAKVPIFGKWYFPDLPANVPLVNLSTGDVETFPAGFRAGAVLYVKEEDLKRAGIGPYKAAPAPAAPSAPAAAPVAAAPAAVAVAATPAQAVAAAAPPAPSPSLHHTPAPAAAHAAPSHGGGHAPAAHTPAHGAAHAAGDHAHPGPKQYVMIALILCVITAVEVWVYYIPALLAYIFPILIVLSLVKFVMVVGWFMHLKFDHVSFTWYFGGGLVLALATFSGLVFLQIATKGPAPGDGNAHTFPPSLVSPASGGATKPAGGH